MTGLFDRVYLLTKQIPVGKVTTYGEIARKLGLKDSRKVGWALHANKDPQVPCHRVVNKDGRLAPNFGGPFSAIGRSTSGGNGADEQRRRLEAEGVVFVDAMHVDLKFHNRE